jgi:hypothetical protein
MKRQKKKGASGMLRRFGRRLRRLRPGRRRSENKSKDKQQESLKREPLLLL